MCGKEEESRLLKLDSNLSRFFHIFRRVYDTAMTGYTWGGISSASDLTFVPLWRAKMGEK